MPIHDNIPQRRLPKYADMRIATLLGPEGPAHTGWLGLVMESGDMRQRVALVLNDVLRRLKRSSASVGEQASSYGMLPTII